jgi:Spy/CpxP family protein refolding chaperone
VNVGRALSALALVATCAAALPAQGDPGRGRANAPLVGKEPGRAGRGGGKGAGAVQPGDRQQTERLVRQAIARAVRKQLKLTDDQMGKLQRSNTKFEQQQRQLLREERATRMNLRTAMADTAKPDQAKITQYLDQLVQLQRRRADLLESEQKELSEFLSPMQRAQFLALRERITRRIQQLEGPPGPGGPPLPDGTI